MFLLVFGVWRNAASVSPASTPPGEKRPAEAVEVAWEFLKNSGGQNGQMQWLGDMFFLVAGEGGSFKDEFEGGLNLDLYVQGK